MSILNAATGVRRARNGLAAIGLVLAVLYIPLTGHLAHFLSVLPWLILLLCPVMHVFVHRQHGAGVRRHPDQQPPANKDSD